jgi:hypothetical protein
MVSGLAYAIYAIKPIPASRHMDLRHTPAMAALTSAHAKRKAG